MRKIGNIILSSITGMIVGVAIEASTIGKMQSNSLAKVEDNYAKFSEFYSILLQWLQVRHDGKTLVDFFKKNGYRTVAIYGMKEMGEALLNELEGTEIEVKYSIDRDADNIYATIDVYKPTDELETVDVVVVTATHYYDLIADEMSSKFSCPIISLEDVVWEI